MRKVTKEELNEILSKHKMWLNREEGGKRANLMGADLTEADLSGVNLIGANLKWTSLSRANLKWANLKWASLTRANLRRANLTWANLSKANLTGAILERADLTGAILTGANLTEANLERAYLTGAYLYNTNLNNTKINLPMICPEKGSFIGYKKAQNQIIEFLIPEDAQRSSATTRICRCDKAKVLSITNLDGTAYLENEVASNHDPNFIYKIGDIVSVDNFDPNRWNECSTGIHFFMTREEAIGY